MLNWAEILSLNKCRRRNWTFEPTTTKNSFSAKRCRQRLQVFPSSANYPRKMVYVPECLLPCAGIHFVGVCVCPCPIPYILRRRQSFEIVRQYLMPFFTFNAFFNFPRWNAGEREMHRNCKRIKLLYFFFIISSTGVCGLSNDPASRLDDFLLLACIRRQQIKCYLKPLRNLRKVVALNFKINCASESRYENVHIQ